MKEQIVPENHNSVVNGDKRGIYYHPEVWSFTDSLLDEIESRSAVLLRSDESNYMAYRSASRDIVDIGAVALSEWIDTKGTARGLRNIALRVCSALMNLECGIGLCSDRFQWKPPAKTMRVLTGLCKNV